MRDYLLLAGLGCSSVRLDLGLGSGQAEIEVYAGQIYNAAFEDLLGLEALVAVLWQGVLSVSLQPCRQPPACRQIHRSWHQLIWPTSDVKLLIQAFDELDDSLTSYRTQAMEAISLFEDPALWLEPVEIFHG